MSDWKSRAIPVPLDQNSNHDDWKSRAIPAEEEEPGLMESALRGAAQGLTFGFSDELAGGLEAAGQAAGVKGLGGKIKDIGLSDEGPTIDMDKLMSAYQQGRDAERLANKKAEEANPVTSFVGNLAGGMAVPMGSLGALKGASTVEKMASGAKLGAAAGAAAGLGSSEADLTKGDAINAAKDTGYGAATGSVIGAALPAAVEGVKGLDELLSEYKSYDLMKKAFQRGKEGVELFGSKAKERLAKSAKEIGGDIIDTLKGEQRVVGNKMEASNKANNINLNMSDKINELIAQKPKVINPDDINIVNKIQKSLENSIEKVEIKEPVFTAVSGNAGQSNTEKAFGQINKIVAADNKNAYDNLARYIVAKEQGMDSQVINLSKKLEASGIDVDMINEATGKIDDAVRKMAKTTSNPDDIISMSKQLQDAKIFPDARIVKETDPQTGLDVIRAVRGNSTKSIPVPPQVENLVTKLKLNWEPKTVINKPTMNTDELLSTVDAIKSYSAQNIGDKRVTDWINKISTDLKKMAPNYAERTALDSEYAKLVQAKANLGIGENYGTSAADRISRETKERELANLVANSYEGKSGSTQKEISLGETLDTLKDFNPKATEQLKQRITTAGEDTSIARALTAQNSLGGHNTLTSIATQLPTRTLPIAGGYGAGKAIYKSKDIVTNISKALYNQTPEQLQGVLQKLKQASSPFAEKFEKILSQPDRKRNALLFSLMQQPGFRREMEGAGVTGD